MLRTAVFEGLSVPRAEASVRCSLRLGPHLQSSRLLVATLLGLVPAIGP